MEIGIAPTMEPVWMNQNFVYSKWVQLPAQNGGESQKDNEKWFQAGSKMLQSGTQEIALVNIIPITMVYDTQKLQ